MYFTIDHDNNITALAEAPTGANQAETFSSEKELAKLSADWPASRLVEIWNSFAGVAPFDDLKPVKKFTDRKGAVTRIFKAVERLTPTVAPQLAQDAPKKQRASKSTAKKSAPKTPKSDGQARAGSKKAGIIALLQRPSGATLGEIMEASGWQAHSVRGFIAGTLGKKMGLTVASIKREDGQRVYAVSR